MHAGYEPGEEVPLNWAVADTSCKVKVVASVKTTCENQIDALQIIPSQESGMNENTKTGEDTQAY